MDSVILTSNTKEDINEVQYIWAVIFDTFQEEVVKVNLSIFSDEYFTKNNQFLTKFAVQIQI